MKKFLKYSTALLIAGLIPLTSCLKSEEDDIFDKNAADRLDDAIAMYTDLLTSEGGRWQMEYYANVDNPGYVYLMTFAKDGSVQISGENKWIGKLTDTDNRKPVYGTDRSLWEVIADNGPVLSFNSYNPIFHLFANPEDIPNENEDDPDEQGYGHDGDYEFDLIKYTGDTLYMLGKKNELSIIMTRVKSELDDKAYLDNVIALADSFFTSKLQYTYLTLPSGQRYMIKDGSTLMVSLCPEYTLGRDGVTWEPGDWVTFIETHNSIITPGGLSFMLPVTLGDDQHGHYTVQHFLRQDDGSLLCREDGLTRITCDTLSKVMTDQMNSWTQNAAKMGGTFQQKFQSAADGIHAEFKTTNLQYIRLYYTGNNVKNFENRFGIQLVLKRGSSTINTHFTMLPSRVEDDKVMYVVTDERDNNAKTYSTRAPQLMDLLNYISQTTFKIEPNSALAPTEVKLVDANDASSFFVVTLDQPNRK